MKYFSYVKSCSKCRILAKTMFKHKTNSHFNILFKKNVKMTQVLCVVCFTFHIVVEVLEF